MTRKRLVHATVLFVLLTGTLIQGCASSREPWVGYDFWHSLDQPVMGSRLQVGMSDIDDVGDIWVINSLSIDSGYFYPVLRAQWRNVEGATRGDLTRHLDKGINYVLFTLFNRHFKGASTLGSGGKYSAKLEIFLDGRKIYTKSLYDDFNEEKLIFASAFKVIWDGHNLRISDFEIEEKQKVMNVVTTGISPLLHRTITDADYDPHDAVYKIIITTPEFRQALDELKKLQERLGTGR